MKVQHPLTKYRAAEGLTLEALAPKLGVVRSALCKWENGRVPAERVLKVEAITGISRHELRPDLYPPPPSQEVA